MKGYLSIQVVEGAGCKLAVYTSSQHENLPVGEHAEIATFAVADELELAARSGFLEAEQLPEFVLMAVEEGRVEEHGFSGWKRVDDSTPVWRVWPPLVVPRVAS